jgi:hypothetical protein
MRAARGLAAPALALAVGLASGGCGGDGPAAQAGSVGPPVRVADCEAWRDAGVRDRYAMLESLRAFAGDRTGSPAGHGATLDDEDAYDLLERSCEASYAQGFKLYKLYTRAAAFSGLRENGR